MKTKHGFTLVELMLTATLAGVVTMAAGSLLITSNRTLTRQVRSTEMQRDASMAMRVIEHAIREGSADGTIVQFADGVFSFDTTGNTRVELDTDTREIRHYPSGVTLVRNQWQILSFTAQQLANQSWYVNLSIRDPQTQIQIDMPCTFTPRDKWMDQPL